MSFCIYRLAKKNARGRNLEEFLAQTITLAERASSSSSSKAGTARAAKPNEPHSLEPTVRRIYRDRRNSRRASLSRGLSFSNFSVTCSASPLWRRMASSRVTEAPSCIRRECRRTPHSGAVRILLDVLSNAARERFFQVIEYIFLP